MTHKRVKKSIKMKLWQDNNMTVWSCSLTIQIKKNSLQDYLVWKGNCFFRYLIHNNWRVYCTFFHIKHNGLPNKFINGIFLHYFLASFKSCFTHIILKIQIHSVCRYNITWFIIQINCILIWWINSKAQSA